MPRAGRVMLGRVLSLVRRLIDKRGEAQRAKARALRERINQARAIGARGRK